MNTPAPDPKNACTSCGAPNALEARFCNQCGMSLGQSFNATTLTISSPPVSLPMSQRSLAVASTRPPPASSSARPGPPVLQDRATDARDLADPLIGVVVAERYRIKEPIGRGGMGVVYRVEHARIGKLMALKLLTGELTRDPQQVARFKREAQLVSRLSHPNTVQVFDFGASDGLVYLAMEYLKGEDLGHLIRRVGPLGVERTLKIVIQVCSSLAEAHEKGMVHRDLKPENIIVMQGGEEADLIKVLDFGLAKLREGGELSEVTSRGAIVGTPYYMSPEQIRGDDVGPESDVYSLGALTYACLTGTVVFDAHTPMGVLTKHLTELPESPSRRFPDLKIPASVSQIVLSTLEKDPKKRLPSVDALQKSMVHELEEGGKQSEVERLLDFSHLRQTGDAEAATRDEVERYEHKLKQRGRALWAVAAALVLAALVLGFRTFQRLSTPPVFNGDELEPNDAASEATRVPFPFTAKGIVGKRLDKSRSDRDFYRFRVPSAEDPVSFEVSAVPGFAWCGLLYRGSAEDPLGRYCPGVAEHRLYVDALKLPAGEYVLGLMQDREAYTKDAPPPTLEFISETYRVNVGNAAATRASTSEIEPNDFARDATLVAPGEKREGQLAWMRDVDFFCSSANTKVRLRVTDAAERARAHAAVLQVTPLAGDDTDVPARVHRAGTREVTPSARDSVGPWQSTVMDPSAGPKACVQLVLVPNPWAPTPHPFLAPAGEEPYVVEVVNAP